WSSSFWNSAGSTRTIAPDALTARATAAAAAAAAPTPFIALRSFRAYSRSLLFQSPLLVEEPRDRDRSIRRQHRVVAEPRIEPGVRAAEVFVAEGVAAVDHDVALRVQRVRIDQNGDVIGCGEFLRADR